MSSLTTTTPVKVAHFATTLALGLELCQLKGSQFVAFVAAYDMTAKGKMVKKHRATGNPNPYLSGLIKLSQTQASVTFNYENKVESRGGEFGETKGNWEQAVILQGKLTPLAVHKGDIETALPPGLPDTVANRHAVMDASGSVQFLPVDNLRLYLRCELTRDNGEGSRAERNLRVQSWYFLPDGTEVSYAEVEPYLASRPERTDETDMVTVGLGNILAIRFGGVEWRPLAPAYAEPRALPAGYVFGTQDAPKAVKVAPAPSV